MTTPKDAHDQWELWEVFVQEKTGDPHAHAGSLRAPDAEMALQNARDVYARRGEAVSIWVVKTTEISATVPEDNVSFFEGPKAKAYRHSHFYKLPKGMKDQ